VTDYADELTSEYAEQRDDYVAFTDSLSQLLSLLTKDAGLDIVGIEHRTKSLESFREKVDRPEKAQKYKHCEEVTDISAIRVIAYLQEEHDEICDIMRENFAIDEGDSANKEDLLDPDKFGYRSMHFVIAYSAERLKLPEFRRFVGKKAEVQVRTVLQHAWAAIDWKLRYKTEVGVPNAIRRRLYRISALLESADDDLSRVSAAVRDLRAGYVEQIQKGDLSLQVNQDSLQLFLAKDDLVQRLQEVAEGNDYVISPYHPNSRNPLLNLLETLKTAGIDEIALLESRLQEIEPQAEEFLEKIFAAWWSETKPKKLVIDQGSLIRLLVIAIAENGTAREILLTSPFGAELQRAVEEVVAVW
jgi:ppGpp synthetase/RelA/SpoT-type nucleotidyltranferase